MSMIEHMQLDLIEEDENVTVVNQVPLQEVTETTLDLENYINNYKGFGKYLRLIFIARRCRPLRLDALLMALNWLKETWNFVEYSKLFNIIGTVVREDREIADSALAVLNPGICCREDFNFQRFQTRISYDPIRLPDCNLLIFDSDWVDRIRRNSNQTLDQLDTDLKNYKANNMAESIRRGCDELASVNMEIGDLLSANKNYTRSRDYCKTDSHELAMCMNVIRVSIYLGHWRHVSSYVDRAATLLENIPTSGSTAQQLATSSTNPTQSAVAAAIESTSIDLESTSPTTPIQSGTTASGIVATTTTTTVTSQSQTPPPNSITISSSKNDSNNKFNLDQKETRNKMRAMLHCVVGLLELHERNFSVAARSFLQADHDHVNFNNILTANDVALYGTLCSLATFDRNNLKTNVINNTNFKQFLENEPTLRDMLHSFYNFQYADCLRAMAQIKNQLLLDIYLADHVEFLYREIRNRALCQYFSPYKQAHLSRVATCFNTTVSDLVADELRPLIANGQLKAKIDSGNQLLVAAQPSLQQMVYSRATKLVSSYRKRLTAACVYNACIRSDVYRSSGVTQTSSAGASSVIVGNNIGGQTAAQNFGDVQMEYQ